MKIVYISIDFSLLNQSTIFLLFIMTWRENWLQSSLIFFRQGYVSVVFSSAVAFGRTHFFCSIFLDTSSYTSGIAEE
jgi:hypothetical protein